jgi:hypothetical protein
MPRKSRAKKRRQDVRTPIKTVFIVTEGKETERIYFRRFRNQLATNDYSFDPGDEIWCVFDVDRTNNAVLQQVQGLANKHNIHLILSNPLFEMWFLLHYRQVTAPLSGGETINELKRFVPVYEKSMDIYDSLIDLQSTAIRNAQELYSQHRSQNINILSVQSNPSTMLHELVQHLNNM